ncbi:peptidoglycan-binding protein [Streptomyces tendae]|uniref:Helix-turn-helix domain-containing protein n=1 Tax=Streptomyces tendae TaxID=1932 RepID=A0ABX5ZK87_STRTE|nr:peptidoglycan-binding protein [Streptomyces tendae]QER84848.1 helix-turn-helix domain-containing protein [Streptomyces tendae]
MSRGKELPAELHPQVRHLIVRLRRLKDRSECSTRQVAARTGYSARSWERYLGGRSLPPREAVEALARVCGGDPNSLLVLHEMASHHWGEAHEGSPSASPPATGHEPPAPVTPWPYGRAMRVALTAGATALVLSVSAVLVLAAELAEARETARAARADTVAAAGATAPDPAAVLPSLHTCRLEQDGGRWYAGHSRTRQAVATYGHVGSVVIEAQCLLRRAGASPGDVDGIYGPLTRRAVRRFQDREGLTVDGVVGPDTWRALRTWRAT